MRQFQVVALAAACSLGAVPMATAATNIGVAAAVNQSAVGTPPGGGQRVIQLGSNVIFNERIVTSDVGLVQILLADGTTFTVGKNSELVIDSFIYDPAAGTAKVIASFAKGTMRFIGGRTSSTPGGVVVRTAVGTVGIRGGMVDFSVVPEEARVDFVAGDETTIETTAGELRRITQPGYSFIAREENGRVTVEVVKTPEVLVLENSGEGGGAEVSEEEAEAESEAVTAENSAYTPTENNQTGSGGTETTTAATPGADEADDVTTDASSGTIRDEVAENPPPPPPPPPPPTDEIIPVRVLLEGATYEADGGDSIPNPGSVGLVGGTSQTDQTVSVAVPENSSTGTGEIDQGSFTIPVFDDPTYQTRAVNGTSPFGGMSGTAYTRGDFAAYFFGIGGDETDPFWVVRGDTPTDFVPTFSGDGIRRYSLENDPVQDYSLPFFRADVLGAVAGAASTDFYVIEQTDPTQTAVRTFQTWLFIDGQGASQRSAVGVFAGGIGPDDDGEYGIDSGRRGGYRASATSTSFLNTGGIQTLEGPVDGDEFYGPNGENFIVGYALEGLNDSFFQSPSNRNEPDPGLFGTTHVANLIDETPKGDFVRTNRDLRGFSAGTLESWTLAEGPQDPTIIMSDDLDGVDLRMNATNSSIGGTIAARDTIDGGSSQLEYLEVAFGFGIQANPEGGGSALIGDDIYGAVHNSNTDRSFIQLDGDPEEKPQISTNNASTYVVSYDAAPQNGIMGPSSEICECAFLEWGWWGTRVRARDPNAPDPEEEIFRASVHLGTWVAGDVSTHDGIDASNPGATAAYAGHAIGSVIDTNTGAQYIAGGSMDMTWNFEFRAGNVTISDFDGRTFGANIAGPAGPGDAVFSGEIEPLFPSLHGTINGAFVNNGSDPAGGVLGNFGVEGADFKAVGTIAGGRLPDL